MFTYESSLGAELIVGKTNSIFPAAIEATISVWIFSILSIYHVILYVQSSVLIFSTYLVSFF